jgi:hypothetical protein
MEPYVDAHSHIWTPDAAHDPPAAGFAVAEMQPLSGPGDRDAGPHVGTPSPPARPYVGDGCRAVRPYRSTRPSLATLPPGARRPR